MSARIEVLVPAGWDEAQDVIAAADLRERNTQRYNVGPCGADHDTAENAVHEAVRRCLEGVDINLDTFEMYRLKFVAARLEIALIIPEVDDDDE